MGWLIIETNRGAHTALLSLPQGKACSVLLASCRTAAHTSSAVPLYAQKTSLHGMLRKVCCWDDASFSFIWLQQVEPSGFNETPEGEPRCSVTYLAGEEEALAKRKGKTLYTHKSHGCGLGGWLSLINRQGIERGKAGEEQLTLERNRACGDKGGIIKARLSFQTCPTNGFLFFVS